MLQKTITGQGILDIVRRHLSDTGLKFKGVVKDDFGLDVADSLLVLEVETREKPTKVHPIIWPDGCRSMAPPMRSAKVTSA